MVRRRLSRPCRLPPTRGSTGRCAFAFLLSVLFQLHAGVCSSLSFTLSSLLRNSTISLSLSRFQRDTVRLSDTDRLTLSSVFLSLSRSLSLPLLPSREVRTFPTFPLTRFHYARNSKYYSYSTCLYFVEPSLFRSLPLPGNHIVDSPCPTPTFPFCRYLSPLAFVPFSRSLMTFSLSHFPAFARADFSSRSRCPTISRLPRCRYE